jgi:uncharacterized protein YjiS (DUF1127 family)
LFVKLLPEYWKRLDQIMSHSDPVPSAAPARNSRTALTTFTESSLRCLLRTGRLAAAWLKDWQWRRRGRRTLRNLSDYELADIGLSRANLPEWWDARVDLRSRN